MRVGEIVSKQTAQCGSIGTEHRGKAPILRRENTGRDAILRDE